jgi:hypothetical protein
MMKTTRILIAACMFYAVSASAAKPQIQWNPEYDFSSIKTFEWAESNGATLKQSEPFLHSHIVNAIEYQLTSHGLTQVDANADVRVTYYATVDTDYRLQSSSVGYGFGRYGMSGWGYYGYGMSGPIYTDTRVVEVERGTLMVDIWDTASNELIWRGSVDGITVASNLDKMKRNVDKAINAMVKQADKLRSRAER